MMALGKLGHCEREQESVNKLMGCKSYTFAHFGFVLVYEFFELIVLTFVALWKLVL